ncbi:uncharacterized protein [Pyrus communis]|uniref:uncharacterized protein n=1 Tax=Pyrus communis TaxID=23211 RepID=UPI0035BF8247
MGPQRKMGIYIGYDSPSIIRYLKPLTRDLFTAHFTDCHFDEAVFLSLRGDKITNVPVEHHELSWITPTMSYLDPRTPQSETEVQRILDIQSIAQSMPYPFTDLAKVTRLYIPAANTPARMDVFNVRRNTAVEGWTVPKGGAAAPPTQQGTLAANQSPAPTLKRGRPPGSKDSQPEKGKRHKLVTLV